VSALIASLPVKQTLIVNSIKAHELYREHEGVLAVEHIFLYKETLSG
jgi:hypothetical protein